MFFRMALVCLYMSFFSVTTVAADPQTGPVIKGFGPDLEVPEGSMKLIKNKNNNLSMDVTATSVTKKELKTPFENAPR